MVGLLVCRAFDDKKKFFERCRDTAHDRRGFIIALDDTDLLTLVERVNANPLGGDYPLLLQRFDLLLG